MRNYRPWIGKNYKNRNIFGNKKVMILGESQWGFENVKGNEATNTVLKNYLEKRKNDEQSRDRIFTTLAKICLDKSQVSNEEIVEFWDSVLFYNYITESMTKPGQRPTDEQFKNGLEPFLNIINENKPNYILVCGKKLWFSIPESIGKKGPEDYFWYFPIGAKKEAISTYIYHPSRYPSGTKERNSRKIFQQMMSY